MTEPTDRDTEAVIQSIEQATPDDVDPLADDLDASIGALAGRLDLSGNSMMGISPEAGLGMLRPMIRQKAHNDPESALRTLAIINLETNALLEKHSDLDPVDLV